MNSNETKAKALDNATHTYANDLLNEKQQQNQELKRLQKEMKDNESILAQLEDMADGGAA